MHIRYCIPLLLIISIKVLEAQGSPSFFQYIQNESIAEITLIYNQDLLFSDRSNDARIHGRLLYRNAEQKVIEIPTSIELRGKFRRRNCEFPPIKLRLAKPVLSHLNLAEYHEYKLVTHCNDVEIRNHILEKEMLCYRIFNEITDTSFQVQPIKINFVNEANYKQKSYWCFLIESNKEFAKRLGMKLIDPPIDSTRIDSAFHEQQALFQYLIGNEDYKALTSHNVKLLQAANKTIYTVPYDFDLAKLVNASYNGWKQRDQSIFDRNFKGFSHTKRELDKVLSKFILKKAKLLDVIYQSPGLSSDEIHFLQSFIISFYEKTDANNIGQLFIDD